MPMARRRRSAARSSQHHLDAGARRARPLPHRHRRGVDRAGPRRGCAARRAEDVLRRLSDHAGLRDPPPSRRASRNIGVTTFQAEDEIAAIAGSAIGASYAGSLGVTSSSGPGIALKSEAIGLAIMTELPLVVVNSQRGGPSTGLPTKTEQSDLYQAVYGRNGDAPMPVIAARSPADAFDCAIEAVPHRRPVHDAGHAADRRLYRQCRRAVEGAGHGRLTRHFPVRFHRRAAWPRARRSMPYTRDGKLRACLDQARHAGADAPHRRHREECRHRPYRLCARQPPGDDRPARRQGARDRQRHARAGRRASANRAASSRSSAGARPTARSTRPCAAPRREGSTSATSTCATSGRCRAISATCCAATSILSCPR